MLKQPVFKLADARLRSGFVGIKQLVQDNFSQLERMFTEGRRVTGLSTGYPILDNQTSGLQPSELIILAARPSMGEDSTCTQYRRNVALRHTNPVAVFSLEMSKESLLMRLLASVGKIDAHKFRTGRLGQDDWTKVTKALVH